VLFETENGYGPAVEIMSRPDLTPLDIRQERAREMLRRRLRGWTTREIALFLGCSDRWVRYELADLPESEQRTVLREMVHGTGEIGVAG
jgi:hypothetical protein